MRAFWNPQDPSGVVRDSLQIALLPPNEPPVVTPGALSTVPGTPVEIDLRTLVSDAETPDDGLWLGLLEAIGGSAELLADGRTARFTPADGFSGNASFSFAVRDAFTDYRLLGLRSCCHPCSTGVASSGILRYPNHRMTHIQDAR